MSPRPFTRPVARRRCAEFPCTGGLFGRVVPANDCASVQSAVCQLLRHPDQGLTSVVSDRGRPLGRSGEGLTAAARCPLASRHRASCSSVPTSHVPANGGRFVPPAPGGAT